MYFIIHMKSHLTLPKKFFLLLFVECLFCSKICLAKIVPLVSIAAKDLVVHQQFQSLFPIG